jgi:hypothetical protein
MEKATIEHMSAQDFTKLIAESMRLNHTTSGEAFEWPAHLPSDRDTVFLEDIPKNATRGRLRHIAGNIAESIQREIRRSLLRPVRKFRNLQVEFVAHPEADDKVMARITLEAD